MPELLLELFSEEIPSRMQVKAADDLQKLVTDALVEEGLVYESARSFATPRRLTLMIDGLPAKQPDIKEERKGPRVGAPEKALEGFMKAAGLTDISQAQVQEDKKGDFYVAVIEKTGAAAQDVIAKIILDAINNFPWPKSMRWGAGELKWVRPLQSILCTFDGEIVPLEISGTKSGNETYGHRFMASDAISVKGFEDYEAALEKAHVVLDPVRRYDIILHDAKDLALAAGLELIEDDALLKEAAGLVEWPVVLLGTFDETFLDVPPEVIITSIRSHQKCFALRDPGTGKLANKFLLVSNLIAADDGKAIVAGNERVIAARLSDAKFFWDQDKKHTLESRLPKLNDLIFHAKLGTVHDKAHAIAKLAMALAKFIPHADTSRCEQAALLAKADLVTNMVGEFPSLQGLMGHYYARNDGLHEFISNAIAKHYAPLGPSDAVPTEPAEIVTALVDKFYSLVGFFGIDERPTGSRDPYALRRSALGIIRIVLENKLRLNLMEWFTQTTEVYRDIGENVTKNWTQDYDVNVELLLFFADRLKVYLRDQGIKHDLIDAVFSLKNQDDLLMIESRVKALNQFLKTEDGQNLLAGYKRAVNIVRIEEKNDGPGIEYSGDVDPKFFEQDEERTLHAELQKAKEAALDALDKEDFTGAMAAMAPLRAPVDAFFDAVTVNADNQIVRRNRLCLLNQIRVTLGRVADLSKIEG